MDFIIRAGICFVDARDVAVRGWNLGKAKVEWDAKGREKGKGRGRKGEEGERVC